MRSYFNKKVFIKGTHYYLMIVMMMVWGIWSCSPEAKEQAYTYKAPRHIDQTAVTEEEEEKFGGLKMPGKCDPEKCNPALDSSVDNPFQTVFNKMLNESVYAAVVDMDYDNTVRGDLDYRTGEFTKEIDAYMPIKVLKVKEVLVNRFKGQDIDGPHLYFNGPCDANGLCRVNDFGAVYHMWSGVNLVVADTRLCNLNKKRVNVIIKWVFPIEDGYLYDTLGRRYKWEDLKKLYHPVDPQKVKLPYTLKPEYLNCTNMVDPDHRDDYIDDSHNSDTDFGNIDNAPQSDQ